MGAAASGKTYSQEVLLQQLLPESRSKTDTSRLANSVVFVSIDGEIVREVEDVAALADSNERREKMFLLKASSLFKKRLRAALQVKKPNLLL